MSDPANLPYRPCVGVMLVNGEGKVFVGKRIDQREREGGHEGQENHIWQMPQGGIDKGEELHAAGFRELYEETGLQAAHVNLLSETHEELFYDLPDTLIGKMWKGKYRGQRQHWLLMRFVGKDSDVQLDAYDPPEFCDWRWVDPETLPDIIVPFKKRVYRAVLEEFRALI